MYFKNTFKNINYKLEKQMHVFLLKKLKDYLFLSLSLFLISDNKYETKNFNKFNCTNLAFLTILRIKILKDRAMIF